MNTSIKRLGLALVILFASFATALAQTDSQKRVITNNYDKNKLSSLQKEFQKRAFADKQKAVQMANANGWEVFKANSDGSYDELIRVASDGSPVYYTIYNVAAARSTRANHLNTGGNLGLNLDGQNMTAHVWDGGPTRLTHQEFDGPGGNNRVSHNDGNTALNGNSFHAQHVTGTILASGVDSRAKGMAPQARAKTHVWDNDLAEAAAEASNGMLISNHSYGFRADQVPDWWFGAYIEDSRDWDDLMYNSPFYLMVVAAGNDGNNNSSNAQPLNGNSSFDKLTGHSTAKNSMVVANGQDASINNDGTFNSVSINSSSSEGPTDDLRIKPDITGNGTNLFSTYDNSDVAYNSISGTSMASPNVSGTLLLLQQHYNNVNGNFMKAATLKGLALHTADDAGISGPDAIYGWGLLNGRAAGQAITQNGGQSILNELTLSSGQSYTITVNSDGSSPLFASISWTDLAGTINPGTANITTPVLVNDLDIRVTQGGSTFEPYLLTGLNSNTRGNNVVDPFERVDINNASGSYTITVTHKGTLATGSQDFSLIVTGLTGATVACNATTPTGLGASTVGTTSASLGWNSVSGTTYQLRYRAAGTSNWTTLAASGTSTNLSGLAGNTQYEAQVRSICPDGTTSSYSSSTSFTTGSTVCSGGISSFPYAESFENTLGIWSQSSADDINWTINSGGTPSNSTGPAGANDGTYYIYMEVSGDGTGFPNKRAILNSSCIDLSGQSAASITFDYQMTGNAVGSVALEVSSDNGGSWTSIWNESGDQGASWNSANINLNAYAGSSIILRFNGVSGNSWQGDIAIDNLAITSGSTSPPPSGCVSGISSFPYSEGFENTLGAWTNATGDDLNWEADASGTPSNNTGPSSATEGTYYLFVEVSGNGTGFPSKQAILNSPCFDLSGQNSAFFGFKYHMFGAANMGSLTVEASANNGSTWTSVWTRSGNQGNSWESATIDLSSYAGGSVQLRFNTISGDTWQGDIAIDDISLSDSSTPTSICDGVEEFVSGQTYNTGDRVTFEGDLYERNGSDWTNLGSCSQTSINAYAITNEAFGGPFEISIYPNPATGNVLQVNSSRDNVNFNIISMSGREVHKGSIEGNQIDISNIANGAYLIQLISDTDRHTIKFTKK